MVKLFTAALGRVISNIGVARVTDRRDGRDVDDRAGTALKHVRQDMLAGDEAAGDDEVEGPAPRRLVELDGASHCRVADVVVEHVDAAMLADDFVHDSLDGVRVCDVAGERGCGSAFTLDDVDRLLRGFAVDVHAGDMSAVAGEQDRRCLSIAPSRTDRARAEQDCDLVFETLHHRCSLQQSAL
jgi:hypothetical protein